MGWATGKGFFSCGNRRFYSPTHGQSTAEDFVGTEVLEAVITVPAYFNDAQRQATKDAGKIAGLDVKRSSTSQLPRRWLTGSIRPKKPASRYDLGGGTFDISIVELSNGVFEVRSTTMILTWGGGTSTFGSWTTYSMNLKKKVMAYPP